MHASFQYEARSNRRQKYDILANSRMTKTSSSGTIVPLTARSGNTDFECETLIRTQEEVDEHIKTYTAPLT